ncbi:MAG: hypothetical protein Ct9H300mP28_06290 [Pseudomonadota bacterium]|nr:MAG: hypothetical protein Ct9H300mP28_06290 [Pseudomonadota bacterium]
MGDTSVSVQMYVFLPEFPQLLLSAERDLFLCFRTFSAFLQVHVPMNTAMATALRSVTDLSKTSTIWEDHSF